MARSRRRTPPIAGAYPATARPVQAGAHAAPRRSGGAWGVVFWVAVAVLAVALAALAAIAWTYWHADRAYRDLADAAFAASDEGALAGMTVDWGYLRSVNPDVVAWVYIPGTRVNYPVVHADDNQAYLYTDFNGNTDFSTRSGTIFLDCSNAADFSDANNVLYGHHMNDGSMFACLSQQLTDADEFNAHRSVYVLTPTMNYRFESFSLVLTTGYDAIVETSFAIAADRAAYVQDKIDRSTVTPSDGFPQASQVERLLTLSTCDYTQSNGRAVLFAEQVEAAAPSTGEGSAASEEAAAVLEASREAA